MREGSYFSSTQEHYIGSELSFPFCVFLLIFFPKTLGLSFWFELVLHGSYMPPGGERTLTGKPWRHPRKPSYGNTSSHLVFGAEELAIRGRPKPPLASSSVGQAGCPIHGTAVLQPSGAGGTLTARRSAPQVSVVFTATVPGPIAHLPN